VQNYERARILVLNGGVVMATREYSNTGVEGLRWSEHKAGISNGFGRIFYRDSVSSGTLFNGEEQVWRGGSREGRTVIGSQSCSMDGG